MFEQVGSERRADYLDIAVMGRGEVVDGGWRFRWRRAEASWEALVRPSDGGLLVTFPGREDAWPRQLLEPGAVIQDDVVELAPRTGLDDWEKWFDVQLTGHFASADIVTPAKRPEP